MGIVIAGYIDLAPSEAERIIRDAEPLIVAALAEPGCRAYTWVPDPLRPGRVHVFEDWDDEVSLAAHFAGDPYRDMGAHLRSGPGILGFAVSKYRWTSSEPVYDETGTARADFFTA